MKKVKHVNLRSLFFSCLVGVFAGLISPVTPCASGADALNVKVLSHREGNLTHVLVRNDEFCEVTMTFEMGLMNLKASTNFPCTVTLPAGQTTEVFTVSPIDTNSPWCYDYTNYFKLGSKDAEPDPNAVYGLPYAPGQKFKVTQGYNGKFSHQGSNLYAIDWKMPEGTAVYAARGGIVVRTKDDSDLGGNGMQYDPFNNFVLIRHDDGTLGHYCHLQPGGVVVKPGQRVEVGQLIAHSGNTGFSTGAHLHFCVFKTKNGRERVSIPVKFQTASDPAITLVEGHSYRANGQERPVAISSREETPGRGGAGL